MEKQRYVVLDKNGKANIVQKADSRFVGIDEMAQHIAMNVIDDYQHGSGAVRETYGLLPAAGQTYLLGDPAGT